MFEAITPKNEAVFEALQKFCNRIGSGRVYGKKLEMPFMMLDHPIEKKQMIVVYNNEENEIQLFDWRDIEKMIASLMKNETFYSIPLDTSVVPEKAMILGTTAVLLKFSDGNKKLLSPKQYNILREFFDETNPLPWEEIHSGLGKP